MSAGPVRYSIGFEGRRDHYIGIEAVLPATGAGATELFMPVWTPGSYLIREYSRHVESVEARDESGRLLPVEKSRKNRWRIQTNGAREIGVTYRVYCREMSVRTNWVEDSFAFLNGAPTFITALDAVARPHEVRLDLPPQWAVSMCGLDESESGAHHYVAPDYDALVDSPIYVGNARVRRFEIDGVPHFLVNEGEFDVWDGPRSACDVERIFRHTRWMWGALPYRKYVMLNLLTEASGGLEHRNSMCVMASRWATRTRAAYLGWLDLVSHEFFHVWNAKRLRPVELGPFDYERENPTRGLWIAEGITEYYGPLIVRRAGLSTPAEYLGAQKEPVRGSLSELINALQSTPGRSLQSLEEASFDAWIKLYRPDENTKNTSISYYTKGAVVAWLLDARIRRATAGVKSLDDVMRFAFDRFSGPRGFTMPEFKSAAEGIAGVALEDFFRRAVQSTEELDYDEALDWFGVRFQPPNPPDRKAWAGFETRVDHGRLVISRIPRDGPAANSGLSVDDEIIAIDDFRVRADRFAQQLENYSPRETLSILIARRDRLEKIELELGEKPCKWQVEVRPDITPEQKKHLDAWLESGVAEL